MEIEIITPGELGILLKKMNAIQKAIEDVKPPVVKDWLTGEEVIELLDISSRTLQNYRDRGILGFSAVGKKLYYKRIDVEQL
ncbi:MAG TPA: helix-turn-helix domain-containing protein, partial [Emticicia sp.]